MKAFNYILAAASVAVLAGCGNGTNTYSILADDQIFQQNGGQQNTKIDIMWVVDNSGSMLSSQQNLANNFPSFIQNISSGGYDFRIAVTTTDAYLALPTWTNYYNSTTPAPAVFEGRPQIEKAWFRNGTPGNPSGYSLLDMFTPDLHDKFMINAMQGVNGRGDERSLQSMRTALESAGNSGFVRPGGFLAVVLLTDEDDFSHDGTQQYERYDRPLHTIDSYVSFLDGLTGSSGPGRRYSVNTIAVPDQTCLNSIYNGAQKIGLRVMELADATGGVKGNLCGNFATELELISRSIVELSTQFFLNGDPIPETIQVVVGGVTVPQASGGSGGWTYNAATNSIVFSAPHIPPQGATIKVTFDPKKITF